MQKASFSCLQSGALHQSKKREIFSENGIIISPQPKRRDNFFGMRPRNGIIISPRRNGREISRPCFGFIILKPVAGCALSEIIPFHADLDALVLLGFYRGRDDQWYNLQLIGQALYGER